MLEGHDSRSITFEAGSARSPTPGSAPRDIDGVVGQTGTDFAVPGAHRAGVALVLAAWASPRCSRRRRAIATGLATDRAHQRGLGRRVHRPRRRPRRGPARRTSSSPRSGCSPPPSSRSSRAGTCTSTAPRPRRSPPSPRRSATTATSTPRRATSAAARSPSQDILDSRMVADPFHLLDCAMTSEGGCALVLARADIAARPRARTPVYVLGGNTDHFGPSYQQPAGVGPRRQPAPRPRRRHGRAARRRDRVADVGARARPTSTCASSTTRSRSRSSASSRRSGSAPRARAATS